MPKSLLLEKFLRQPLFVWSLIASAFEFSNAAQLFTIQGSIQRTFKPMSAYIWNHAWLAPVLLQAISKSSPQDMPVVSHSNGFSGFESRLGGCWEPSFWLFMVRFRQYLMSFALLLCSEALEINLKCELFPLNEHGVATSPSLKSERELHSKYSKVFSTTQSKTRRIDLDWYLLKLITWKIWHHLAQCKSHRKGNGLSLRSRYCTLVFVFKWAGEIVEIRSSDPSCSRLQHFDSLVSFLKMRSEASLNFWMDLWDALSHLHSSCKGEELWNRAQKVTLLVEHVIQPCSFRFYQKPPPLRRINR